MPRSRGLVGFTLIELTVVLAVIVTLALVLTPSIANFLNDSRTARARTDCQTIAAAVVEFYKDSGFFPQWSRATDGGPGTFDAQLDLLVTAGNAPRVEATGGLTEVGQVGGWVSGRIGAASDQLVSNAAGYALRTAVSPFGWNGPYVSSGLGSDPWNNRYIINIGMIAVGQGAMTAGGVVKSAVWVLSAGPNGTIETAYSQPITTAVLGGDDIGQRIQ